MHTWHYVKLAEVFRQSYLQLRGEGKDLYPLKVAVKHMMDMLKQENSRFSRDIFLDYIIKGPKKEGRS